MGSLRDDDERHGIDAVRKRQPGPAMPKKKREPRNPGDHERGMYRIERRLVVVLTGYGWAGSFPCRENVLDKSKQRRPPDCDAEPRWKT